MAPLFRSFFASALLPREALTAPSVFDGPINGACFRAHVAQALVPTLRPGDIVFIDNVRSHKSPAALV
jgi:hypothetical protein